MSGDREVWADFWAASGPAAGCLPRALEEIDAAERALWQDFARRLPKGARVLDLGTGDGAVPAKMAEARRDLRLTGVDSSPRLPRAPRGVTLRAGVPIEALPFAAASFDAVTSQFGYEYADAAAAAREVARVLKPGGRLLFVVHRSDGSILAHNLPRREALVWALEGGWLAKARALAAARRGAPLPTPPAFRTAAEEAQRRFPRQSVAAEFLQAVAQTLEMGRTKPPHESLEVLDTLEAKARNEIGRIDSLARAACDEARLAELAAGLREAGIAIDPPGTLAERGSKRPFAWLLSGARRSA
ncbi:MAG: class I SAM-dependent methyltransferase [Pseudomonadota bacterium]|nr:class I SAM-dependent methyltransferase [Pseudomonadota bacterium]